MGAGYCVQGLLYDRQTFNQLSDAPFLLLFRLNSNQKDWSEVLTKNAVKIL